jgi:hypothetical protein
VFDPYDMQLHNHPYVALLLHLLGVTVLYAGIDHAMEDGEVHEGPAVQQTAAPSALVDPFSSASFGTRATDMGSTATFFAHPADSAETDPTTADHPEVEQSAADSLGAISIRRRVFTRP